MSSLLVRRADASALNHFRPYSVSNDTSICEEGLAITFARSKPGTTRTVIPATALRVIVACCRATPASMELSLRLLGIVSRDCDSSMLSGIMSTISSKPRWLPWESTMLKSETAPTDAKINAFVHISRIRLCIFTIALQTDYQPSVNRSA